MLVEVCVPLSAVLAVSTHETDFLPVRYFDAVIYGLFVFIFGFVVAVAIFKETASVFFLQHWRSALFLICVFGVSLGCYIKKSDHAKEKKLYAWMLGGLCFLQLMRFKNVRRALWPWLLLYTNYKNDNKDPDNDEIDTSVEINDISSALKETGVALSDESTVESHNVPLEGPPLIVNDNYVEEDVVIGLPLQPVTENRVEGEPLQPVIEKRVEGELLQPALPVIDEATSPDSTPAGQQSDAAGEKKRWFPTFGYNNARNAQPDSAERNSDGAKDTANPHTNGFFKALKSFKTYKKPVQKIESTGSVPT
jgi:hypothetical protein